MEGSGQSKDAQNELEGTRKLPSVPQRLGLMDYSFLLGERESGEAKIGGEGEIGR